MFKAKNYKTKSIIYLVIIYLEKPADQLIFNDIIDTFSH